MYMYISPSITKCNKGWPSSSGGYNYTPYVDATLHPPAAVGEGLDLTDDSIGRVKTVESTPSVRWDATVVCTVNMMFYLLAPGEYGDTFES